MVLSRVVFVLVGYLIYINDLARLLEKSGFGCMFNGIYIGFVLYTDDILLMTGSGMKLQKLRDIYFNYAESIILYLLATSHVV